MVNLIKGKFHSKNKRKKWQNDETFFNVTLRCCHCFQNWKQWKRSSKIDFCSPVLKIFIWTGKCVCSKVSRIVTKIEPLLKNLCVISRNKKICESCIRDQKNCTKILFKMPSKFFCQVFARYSRGFHYLFLQIFTHPMVCYMPSQVQK